MMKEGSAAEELSTPLLSTADGGGDPVKPALGKSALSNSSSNQADVLTRPTSTMNLTSPFPRRFRPSSSGDRDVRIIDTDHDKFVQFILQGGGGDDERSGREQGLRGPTPSARFGSDTPS